MRRLLIRPGAIGDCITCLPVMEQLQADYTEVWVPSPLVPLVQFADCVRPLSQTGLDLVGVSEEIPKFILDSLSGFDSIISWYGTNRPEFRESATQLNENWQFLPALPPKDGSEHATDYFARLAQLPPGLKPVIRTNALEPRESIVIHPFSGSGRKNWPLPRFRQLSERLSLRTEWVVGPDEQLPNAQRFDDLSALARWIRGARLYVGNDSGITHLAAATGACTVALFGATAQSVWAPRGDCVTVVHATSMQALEVDDVLAAINLLLDSKQLSVSTAE